MLRLFFVSRFLLRIFYRDDFQCSSEYCCRQKHFFLTRFDHRVNKIVFNLLIFYKLYFYCSQIHSRENNVFGSENLTREFLRYFFKYL